MGDEGVSVQICEVGIIALVSIYCIPYLTYIEHYMFLKEMTTDNCVALTMYCTVVRIQHIFLRIPILRESDVNFYYWFFKFVIMFDLRF